MKVVIKIDNDQYSEYVSKVELEGDAVVWLQASKYAHQILSFDTERDQATIDSIAAFVSQHSIRATIIYL